MLIAQLAELHERVEELPEDQHEVADLFGIKASPAEVAALLGVSEKTVSRAVGGYRSNCACGMASR